MRAREGRYVTTDNDKKKHHCYTCVCGRVWCWLVVSVGLEAGLRGDLSNT